MNRRRRRGALLSGAAVLAIGAAGGAYALHDSEGSATTSTSALPVASVIRTDMTSTVDADGSLGYDDGYTVLAGGAGRITWLPKAGVVIRRGGAAYGMDGHRVPLFYGSTPFWRDLRGGVSDGYDVLELERNLAALGYGGMTVDRTFTRATATAIKKWQGDLGVTRTGVVALGDVVIQPGAIRVTKVQLVLGAPAMGTVFTAGDTERRVTVDLPVNEAQGVARKGAKVKVALPGGRKATGVVSSVGTVATAGSTNSRSQTGQGTDNATITVTATLDEPSSTGLLDGAPVTVGFAGTEHRNVLAVPINALLASAGGEYSVNVVDAAGNVRSVPVGLGIFDGDNVEATGDLAAGMKVQVPRS